MLKIVNNEIINRIYNKPESYGLRYKEFGKSNDIDDYSEEEIVEMFYGIYKNNEQLYALVDGDYFIDMNDVIQTGCTLEKVSFYGKSTQEEQLLFTPNTIHTIKSFYVQDYFIVTASMVNNTNKHFISRFLWKIGAINTGKNQNARLYYIRNQYRDLQGYQDRLFPKDLYYPIKTHINRLFFSDDYKLKDFIVESEIKFDV